MTDTKTLLHALRALDPRKEESKPELGLSSDETIFTRMSEDYGFLHEFDFEIEDKCMWDAGKGGYVTLTGCTVIGRGTRVELPLKMFTSHDYQMICEEVEEALRQRRERDPDDGGDRAYEDWKDRQLMKGEDC